jgi:hypothetical protein
MEQDRSTLSTLPWICPECFGFLANADVSQNQAKIAFRTHAGGAHWKAWRGSNRAPNAAPQVRGPGEAKPVVPTSTQPSKLPTQAPKGEFWCTVSGCNWRGELANLSRHIIEIHDGAWHAKIPVREFPFELLPPGNWTFDQVLRHYRRASEHVDGWAERRIDYSRLEAIRAFRPSACWVGKRAWKGYVTFEFSNSSSVVLECPVTGNATCVIGGDWKASISLTKAEVRREHRQYAKVNHTTHWLRKLRGAINRLG